jgi:hypothetical protein
MFRPVSNRLGIAEASASLRAADMFLMERDRMRVRVGAGTWKQAARSDQAAAAARRRSAR